MDPFFSGITAHIERVIPALGECETTRCETAHNGLFCCIRGWFGGVEASAPRLLLGFALCNGSKPEGEERGAEQQSMATCVWVDPHGC
jgi:hypothetical protein